MNRRQIFLLRNLDSGFMGNSPMWWKEGDSGYTQWIDDARAFTLDEAAKTISACKGTHKLQMYDIHEIEALAKRTVDIQDMDDCYREPKYD